MMRDVRRTQFRLEKVGNEGREKKNSEYYIYNLNVEYQRAIDSSQSLFQLFDYFVMTFGC